jgi:hypothetical protein
MRLELRQILEYQLSSILFSADDLDFYYSRLDQSVFMADVKGFKYKIDKEMLKINDIFVKYFNQDIFYKPKNTRVFVKALIS